MSLGINPSHLRSNPTDKGWDGLREEGCCTAHSSTTNSLMNPEKKNYECVPKTSDLNMIFYCPMKNLTAAYGHG